MSLHPPFNPPKDQVAAKAVKAYRAFINVDRFARSADLREISANNFNLNISRFADTAEPVESMAKSRRPIFYP